MASKITIAASRPVIQIISSGPGWVTPIVTVLIGAAAALAVQWVIQTYFVPKVESRKRREDRWERDVRELGDLLTTLVRRHANEAYLRQLTYRFLQQRLEEVSGVDQEKLA